MPKVTQLVSGRDAKLQCQHWYVSLWPSLSSTRWLGPEEACTSDSWRCGEGREAAPWQCRTREPRRVTFPGLMATGEVREKEKSWRKVETHLKVKQHRDEGGPGQQNSVVLTLKAFGMNSGWGFEVK